MPWSIKARSYIISDNFLKPLTDSHDFCTIEKRIKFATKPV